MSDDGGADTPKLVRNFVFNRLREDILSCGLRPGSQILARELAEHYKVSVSPVRDALLKLEQEDLVEVLPRKGYRVKPISLSDAHELYDLRLLLERECTLRLIDTASSDILGALDTFRTGVAPTSLLDWLDYNTAFHTFIATNCGNDRLARIARSTLDQIKRLSCVSVTSRPGRSLTDFTAEHDGIIDAIQRRDRRQAAALIRHHIDSSSRRVFDALGNAAIVA